MKRKCKQQSSIHRSWTVLVTILLLSLGQKQFAQQTNTNGMAPINLTKHGFTKSTLKTSVGEMVVFEKGEGEPLLLLHGIGAGASSYIWFTLAPELAKKYRVIAPDFIGWGESYRPAEDVLFEDYVVQIKALGQYIEGRPALVIAQSLTSGFTIAAQGANALHIKKLALFTPSGGKDFGIDAFGKEATANFLSISMSPQREQIYAQIFHQRPAVEDWWRREGFMNGKEVPLEIIESNLYNARQPNAAYSALPFLSGTLRYDLAPYLQQVEVPAIIVWGSGEFRINAENRSRIGKVNPSIEVINIENARTSFEIEQPEQTLDVLYEFLQA